MYTVRCQYTGLPNTPEVGCLVSTRSQRMAPFLSESAIRCGEPIRATGTKTVGPPGAEGSIAADAFIW